MAWTTPVTWVTGQVIGASDLNSQLRDNMLLLFSGRSHATFFSASTGVTITATSLTVVSTSLCRLTVSASHTSAVFLIAMGFSVSAATTDPMYIGYYLDGATSSGNLAYAPSSVGNIQISFTAQVTLAAIGSHTLDLMAACAAGGFSAPIVYAFGSAVEIA